MPSRSPKYHFSSYNLFSFISGLFQRGLKRTLRVIVDISYCDSRQRLIQCPAREDLWCHDCPEHQLQSSESSLKRTLTRRDVRVHSSPSTYNSGGGATPDNAKRCPFGT